MSSDTLSRPLTGRRSCLVSAGLAFVAYFGVRLILENTALAGPLRIVIAMLPVPFFVFFLLTEVRYMRNLDELQRRIQLEALAVAFPVVLLLLMTLGLLQVAGIAISQEDWSYRHIWFLALLAYAVGVKTAERRYR
jgi:hypothetical protein